jgi:hypothetical protein
LYFTVHLQERREKFPTKEVVAEKAARQEELRERGEVDIQILNTKFQIQIQILL